MPTNWPPAAAPAWPPPEVEASGLQCSDLRALALCLLEKGFTHAAPTAAERSAFFTAARCDHDHTVVGRMLVSPAGVRYPVAVCSDAAHRDVLVPWSPFYCGAYSGNYTWT